MTLLLPSFCACGFGYKTTSEAATGRFVVISACGRFHRFVPLYFDVSRGSFVGVLLVSTCDLPVCLSVCLRVRPSQREKTQCLRDSALPVQIEAASSLRYLIELDEAEEPVLQVLPDILNEYFRIMQEIGLDEVISCFWFVSVCVVCSGGPRTTKYICWRYRLKCFTPRAFFL